MRIYKKTTIGAAILILLLLASYAYPLYGPPDFNKEALITDENGDVIGRAPFPPSAEQFFGTDRNGQELHWLLLYGAKYTLITAIGVAILRVIFGGLIGVILSLYTPYLKKYFKDFFIIFRYIPSVFIGLVLMAPVVGMFEKPLDSVVTYQVLILVFMGLPTVTVFASEITDELLRQSFVKTSFLMGGSKFHITRTHLFPFFKSYGVLFLFQQLLSTLQLTMHLGIFGYFLGGQTIGGIIGYDDPPPKAASLTMEWAGLVGQNFNDFVMAPWVIFAPIIGYFVVILIVNMIKKELEANMDGLQIRKKKQTKKQAETVIPSVRNIPDAFELVREEQQGAASGKTITDYRRGKRFIRLVVASLAAVLLVSVITVVESKKEALEPKVKQEKPEKPTRTVPVNRPVPVPKAPPKEAEAKVYSVGEEIQLTRSSLIVTNVEKSQGNEKEKPKPGSEFIIVTVKIANTGQEKVEYAPYYFDIANLEGAGFDQPLIMIDVDTTLPSGELKPGESVTGTLAFQAPIGEQLQLQYLPFMEDNNIVIHLQ